MDGALSIASSALGAATTEIGVTSENLANAQTSGYVSESAQLAAQAGGDALGVGAGVLVTGVTRQSDPLLAANNLQAQGALSSLAALQQVTTGIENVFPLGQSSGADASGTPTNTSVAGQLATFWSSFDGVAQDPSALAPRTAVVDNAAGLVASLNEAATQLGQLGTDTAAQLAGQISQVNTLLGDAAGLNAQIVAVKGGGGDPNQLLDQLDALSTKLAGLVGASVQMQPNGSALISIGGVAVVQDSEVTKLSTATALGTVATPAGPVSAPVTTVTADQGAVVVPVSGGSVAGLLSGLNQALPVATGELNQVATNLATLVDNQLAKGVTASGTPGAALFTINGGTTPPTAPITAATISVNPAVQANPDLLAAATNPTAAANDGSNAAAIAELANATGYTTSPDVAYQQLVQDVGAEAQNATTQVAAQSAVAQQAEQALAAVSGVNQNTELTNLMQFQSSYQASAKLVGVIDTTLQSLLAAV